MWFWWELRESRSQRCGNIAEVHTYPFLTKPSHTFLRVEKRLADVEGHCDGAGDAAGHRARQEVDVGVVAALGVERLLTHGVRRHHGGLQFGLIEGLPWKWSWSRGLPFLDIKLKVAF